MAVTLSVTSWQWPHALIALLRNGMCIAQPFITMELTAPEIVKRVVSKIDLEAVAEDAARVAKKTRGTAMKLGNAKLKEARTLANQNPRITAAIGGGLAVLGVVGLISWLRRD